MPYQQARSESHIRCACSDFSCCALPRPTTNRGRNNMSVRASVAMILLSGALTEAFHLSALAPPVSRTAIFNPAMSPLRHSACSSPQSSEDTSLVCNSLLPHSPHMTRTDTVTTAMSGSGSDFDNEIGEDLAIQVMRKKLHDKWLQGRLKAKTIHLPFKEAVKWARAMGRWESEEEWWEWIEMGEGKNPYIPSNPAKYYGERGEWKGWDHWLGVNKYAPKKRDDGDSK